MDIIERCSRQARNILADIQHELSKFTNEDAEWDALYQLEKDTKEYVRHLEWTSNAVNDGLI